MTINFDNWNFGIFPTILIILFLTLAIYFTYWLFITGVIGSIRMWRSKNWKKTIGKIISLEIQFKKFGGDDETPTSFKFVSLKTYTYVVNGKEYESNQTLASDSLYQKEFKPINQFPKKYGDYKTNPNYLEVVSGIKKSIGNPVTVYYNPNKPKTACLENRFEKGIFLPIIMGFLFGGAFTYLVYYLISPLFKNYYG
jgi:hypothetical protein